MRLEKVEQDTTAACERVVQMQNQTNSAVGLLQEQRRKTTTNIGQLQQHQQGTSDKLLCVSAAVSTIEQVQSDMRSDLEGEFGEVKSSVTVLSASVEGTVRKAAVQNHYRSIHNICTSFGSQGKGNEQFNNPCGITISKDRKMFVADASNHRVKAITLDGTHMHLI